MDKFKNMQVFCKVVELGSFTAVAKDLGVSSMMVSKHIRYLEDTLGISVVNRKLNHDAGGLYVTELGQQYYQKCKRLLEDLNDLECSIQDSKKIMKGTLRINAPIDFGGLYMVPLIKDFQQLYPDVNILMNLGNGAIDLRRQKFDIAVVVTDRLNANVVARRVAETPLCTYASPQYLARYGYPESIESLHEHRCLHYVDTPHCDAWVFASNNGGVLCQAAAAGMGIIHSPALSVKRYVDSGELVEILENYRLTNLSVYATYLQRNYYPIEMSRFVDFLVDYFVS